MTIDKGIFIKNIYYMLTYAFKELRANNYESIAGEAFEDIYDMFAEILAHGISFQLKQGLHREYIERNETLVTLRGKLEINGTMRNYMAHRHRLSCEFDELSEDNLFNQILKSTVELLLSQKEVKTKRRTALRRLMPFFDHVSTINLGNVRWDCLRFDRNSKTYQMLLYLCYFVVQNILLSTDDGDYKVLGFSEQNMNVLFEHFVLEFYKRHHPELHACARQIDFNIDVSKSQMEYLPIMQTDVFLTKSERNIILDAKYYGKTMHENYGKLTVKSPHIYQIMAYVQNLDRNHTGKVDGIMLYAKTQEEVVPDTRIVTNDGNIILFRTLDLDKDFNEIKIQLNQLIEYQLC